jgi:glycosyltransferase involved in cell wall biosynthesis
MRLLLLDQFSDLGGAQQVLLELLPAIAAHGWKGVVGLPGEGEMFARVREIGFDAEAIQCGPYESGRKTAVDLARFALDAPRLAGQIRRLASRIQADLVYINGPRLLPAAALARVDRPVIFHAHSYLGPGAIRQLAGAALRRMRARVVSVARFVAEPWEPLVGADRVSVVYNGVAGPPKLQRPGRCVPVRVGCIGRIAPKKGQLEFAAAAKIIHRALPDCRFAVYGTSLFSSAEYAAKVHEAADGLPIEFPGWTNDIYSAMHSLDVLLVPSKGGEATPRVIPEAFAAGLPVIAFGVGGIPEMVEHGVDGLLVKSCEEMARETIGLLRDPARRAEMSRAAQETWSRRFTLERFHGEILKALEKIGGISK